MACFQPHIKAAYIYASLPVARGVLNTYRNEERPTVTLFDDEVEDLAAGRGHGRGLPPHKGRATATRKPRELTKNREAPDITESAVESDGRISISTQTGLYLEEITDIVETDNFGVQTDQFVDRPTSPIMHIAKTGIDVATQIEPWELFDFEIEVRPLMEVLLNKTMEQALMEVVEEEELAEIRKKQAIFEELRNADLAEVERLEERNRRYREENERRVKQAEKAAVLRQQTAEKIAARSFVKAYLEPILPTTFELLTSRGYFYDNVQQELEESFVSTLMEKTINLNTLELRARLTADGIIREAVLQRHVAYRELGRELMTEELTIRVIPGLRTTLAHMVIKQMLGLAIERLEQAAAARKRVLSDVAGELLEDIINTTVERIAKKQEEMEAVEAEMAEEQID